MERIILIGCGGHAKSVVDSLKKMSGGIKYKIEGFVDKNVSDIADFLGYKVLGTEEDLESIYASGVRNAFLCIGFLGKGRLRNHLYNKLKQIGFHLPYIIDETSNIAPGVTIGEGTFIGKNTILNVDSKIGKMVIINSGAIIEHECMIGDFSHIAVGAVVCGGSEIGANVLIGANATVIQSIKVGNDVIVGAGTVIKQNLKSNMLEKTGINRKYEMVQSV